MEVKTSNLKESCISPLLKPSGDFFLRLERLRVILVVPIYSKRGPIFDLRRRLTKGKFRFVIFII